MEHTIYERKIESFDPRLKRHVKHDERSKLFGFDTTGITIVDVTHKRLIPILNQLQVGSCTGNAGIGVVNTEPHVQAASPAFSPDEAGALKLYSAAEKIDGGVGYPPEDQGSSGISVAQALKNAGVISAYQHTFNLQDALKALTQYPILAGTNWYDAMFNTDPDGRVHPTGKIVGGHEYEGYRNDTENGRIWFHNSWGSEWGISGDFYITWADFNTLLGQDGDVVIPIPLATTPPATWPYKYFKPSEKTGPNHVCSELKPQLLVVLDAARGISNVPYTLTSGMRTVAENEAAGGVSDSAHLRGLAADIACTDATRQAIILGLLTCGTPVFIEDAGSHIHVDVDSTIHAMGLMIVTSKD